MKSFLIFGALLALSAAAAGAAEVHRKLAAVSAPGPAAEAALAPAPAVERAHDPQTDADLLFILSADQAEFTDATTLQLTRVTASVQYHDTYKQGATAGIIKTADFANSSSGGRYVSADGAWLSAPDAALLGDASDGSRAAVLLALSAPVYDSATQSVRFTVSVLPTEERALKMREGVVNGLVHDAAIGKGTPLVTAITPGAMLSDVALFIDSNKAALRPAASTEWGWGGYGGGGRWGGYGGYGGYHSWGWGWGR